MFVYAPFRLAGSFSSGLVGEGFRNVPEEEEADFSIMDVKLEDVEGFFHRYLQLLTLSRLIRSNQDAERPGYDN